MMPKPRESTAPSPALAGTLVLELASFVAGPYCGRLLAQMGAQVIKIEPPDGDQSRRHGPFRSSEPDPETSAVFLYVNQGKKSITLDSTTATGAGLFRRLAAKADVVIEDKSPAVMAELGLDPDALRGENPRLVWASVTPFGLDGPYSRHKAYDVNIFHAGGEGYALPGSLSQELFPGREPVRAGGYLAEYDAGTSAAVAVMSALIARNATGLGQHLDVSKQDAAIGLTRESLQRFEGYGEPIDRQRSYFFGGIFRAKDGYLAIFPRENRHWLGLCEAMGRPDLVEDRRFKEFSGRTARKAELNGIIQGWVEEKAKREAYRLISDAGCPAGYYATAADLESSPQLKARGFFADVEHPSAGRFRAPTAPYRMTKTPPEAGQSAPQLGQHNADVFCGMLGLSPSELADLRRANAV